GPTAEPWFQTGHFTQYQECRRREIYMRIEGDQEVNSFFFDDPGLTLICSTDLLGSSSLKHVASHLAGLYRTQGDGFVCGLRGTFAIVLYDHDQRTLKAWTDHFGAERLVYSECSDSLVVGTNIQSVSAVHGQRPNISPAAIQEYLLYTCIPTPKTIYQGI